MRPEAGYDAPAGSTVLVVEDDPRIASFLTRALKLWGLRAEWVMTGAEALDRIERGGIDVQILDLGLPDCDGLDVLRELRNRGQAVPVIVITARSNPEDRTAALALGACDFFRKPFPLADVREAVRRCVTEPAGLDQRRLP